MSVKRLTYCNVRDTGKTFAWEVFSGELMLGVIKWYAPWRRYCFWPASHCLFDRSCLSEVIEFIDEQMQARKVA